MQWTPPKTVSYMIRFVLLTTGFALAAYGLIGWTHSNFDMAGVWLYDNDWEIHHLHLVICGVGLIPPAMWELFMLELQRHKERDRSEDRVPAAVGEPLTADAMGDG